MKDQSCSDNVDACGIMCGKRVMPNSDLSMLKDNTIHPGNLFYHQQTYLTSI